MVLDPHRWLELRRFRSLLESGAISLSEVARETRLDRKTVRKYLSAPGPATPPRRSPNGRSKARVIDEFAPLVDSMLRAEILMKAAVIHGRLTAEYGFTGNYQRVKLYVQEARPRIAEELGITPKELAGMHRRFEVIPGAQAQVDWGDEGKILAHMGIPKVYSFHMTLSYSRDPFCCFTTSQDLQTFFDCHRRAFAHFGGVPMTIVYDRTKTVVRRHVAPGEAVPLHPEAVGFAGHYDFDIDVLAAYRPTGKGRVERQVLIVRDHVLSGRSFSSVEEMDAAFITWVPQRRLRPTGLTSRSSESGPPAITWLSNRCRRLRIWWPNGTCGRSARTAWSRSAATSTRCPHAGSALVSWWRSGPRDRRSCCTPPSRTPTARHCWPPIRGRSAAGSASSKRPTGPVFPRARDGAPPLAMSCRGLAMNVRWARRPALCRVC